MCHFTTREEKIQTLTRWQVCCLCTFRLYLWTHRGSTLICCMEIVQCLIDRLNLSCASVQNKEARGVMALWVSRGWLWSHCPWLRGGYMCQWETHLCYLWVKVAMLHLKINCYVINLIFLLNQSSFVIPLPFMHLHLVIISLYMVMLSFLLVVKRMVVTSAVPDWIQTAFTPTWDLQESVCAQSVIQLSCFIFPPLKEPQCLLPTPNGILSYS